MGGVEREKMKNYNQDVVDRFAGNETVEIHREFSAKVVFPEKYFDWVYIDGNHSYENVLEDLRHYLPFVKTGGLLCGDDYGSNDSDPYSNQNVTDYKRVQKRMFDCKEHLLLPIYPY